MFSIRSTDNITVSQDNIVLGPIIDRDKKAICNYAIQFDKLVKLDHDTTYFKDLKKILTQQNIKIIGIKQIEQVPMTETDLLNDLEMIHLELTRMREYAEKHDCHHTRDILHNAPHKIFRMKDLQSFESYLDHINKIFDQNERKQVDHVNTVLNQKKFF